jgi:hypothetical protein
MAREGLLTCDLCEGERVATLSVLGKAWHVCEYHLEMMLQSRVEAWIRTTRGCRE